MGMIILICVIIIGIGIFFAIKERDSDIALLGLLVGAGCGMIWLAISFFVGIFCLAPQNICYETYTEPICAISEPKEEKSYYLLSNNSSKSNLYYYYLSEEEDGAKIAHNINSNEVKIYDNEKENPRVETLYMHHPNPIIRFFFITDIHQTIIYIPEGAIKYDYGNLG